MNMHHGHVEREEKENAVHKLLHHFSDWTRLKRAIAWWLRLKMMLRNKTKKTDRARSLTVPELDIAEHAIIAHVQRNAYPAEVTALNLKKDHPSGNGILPKSSGIIKLDPQLHNGILKVGGRLKNAQIPDDAKHQVILPRKHHVTNLIVQHTHRQVGHGGQNHVLSILRQKYWVVGAGCVTRNLIKKCVVCRKNRATPSQQKMADLPSCRVKADEPAFTTVGVDYFGPFEIKCGRSLRKRYGVIFTCMASRAVHLEVAASLETSSCIDAIRRFVSRRGPVKEIYSDNGTNLVGACKELKNAIKELSQKNNKMTEHSKKLPPH